MRNWTRRARRRHTASRSSAAPAWRSAIRRNGSPRWRRSIATRRAIGRFVAASIVLAGADGAVEIAALARRAGLRVFELNVGAPHASEATPGAIVQETDPARLAELVARVRAATEGMALWVKLSGLSASLPALALGGFAGRARTRFA